MKQWIYGWLSNASVVAKVLAVVAVPTALLLFHVWNQYRITDLGYQIAEVTEEHRQLLEENKKLTVEAGIQGRSDRVSQLAQQQFGLQETRSDQIITVDTELKTENEEHARLDASNERPDPVNSSLR